MTNKDACRETFELGDIVKISETYIGEEITSTVCSVAFVVGVKGRKLMLNSASINTTANEHDPVNRWVDVEKINADSSKHIEIVSQAAYNLPRGDEKLIELLDNQIFEMQLHHWDKGNAADNSITGRRKKVYDRTVAMYKEMAQCDNHIKNAHYHYYERQAMQEDSNICLSQNKDKEVCRSNNANSERQATHEDVERCADAIMINNGCGLNIENIRTLCCNKKLIEQGNDSYGDPFYREDCDCLTNAKAALTEMGFTLPERD